MANINGGCAAGLPGKVAVVFGGGRGIGRATALKLAASGMEVIVVARTRSELEVVVEQIRVAGGRAVARSADITRPADVECLAKEIRETSGRIDVMVNSAGLSFIAPFEATTEAEWDQIFAANLKGPYLCIHAMLDLLRASEGACVVNIASKVGLTGYRLVAAYAAAKAGLIGLSRSLAHELGPEGIRVVVLCPGPVDTRMRWAATPAMDPELAISAEAVANTILFLATLDGHVTTGEIILEAINYDEHAVPLDEG